MVDSLIFSSLPESDLFQFPPQGVPAPIPPLPTEFSVMRPFNIPDSLFTGFLDAKVPLTIAALYAVTVKALNRYNLSRGKKPWAMSKTRVFSIFVILHNIFLAVYSAWTFWGMLGGLRRAIANPFGSTGPAATVDSFCRLHGTEGFGRSVYYNESTAAWDSALPGAILDNGIPSASTTGRLWNEGLAYYGWLFYLSKFYEVLDTFIILAKGKPSSTLQTYHHAGAMLCMWAGMRYMSAPIWMFVLFNSFIHSLMYTYYTVTTFSIKVPVTIKRTLTTMQISQFLIGASCTIAHSFISYVVPVAVSRNDEVPAASVASALPSATGAFDSLKQLVFGSGSQAASGSSTFTATTTTTTEVTYAIQPCIVTAGETFAIWLNVLYLAPLTYLFVSFFIASYVKRSNAAQKMGNKTTRRLSNVTLAEKAGWDAAKGLEREVYGGEAMLQNGANGSAIANGDGKATSRKINGKAKSSS